MNVKKFTLASILTAFVIVIEVLAAATGEFLIALTVVSTSPIYIICRKSITLGITSYICVSVILFQINLHQLVFFIFTNGLLGILLGFCDKKINIAAICILISSLMLSIGIIVTANILGILIINLQIGMLVFLFSCIYVAFYRFIAIKVYEKLIELENKIEK